MYDGFKILNLTIDLNKLLDNPLLVFPGHYNQHTGEPINQSQIAKSNGLMFILKNGNCKLMGSIHKFSNNGLHNWNDFYLSRVYTTLVNLWEDYEINPLTAVLNNVEIGVNVTIPFKPQQFLNAVILHGVTSFHPFTNIEGAIGIECKKDQYYVKIYDKSNQYPDAPFYTLRFEISSQKMEYYKGHIKTLSDFLNPDTFTFCSDLLQKSFDELLTCDYTSIPKKLTHKEKSLFDRGTNYKYWENLMPDSKKFKFGSNDIDYKRARKNYYKTLNDFKNLIEKYNCNKMQKIISALIRCKLQILNDYTPDLGDKMTSFLSQFYSNPLGQNDILSIVSIYPSLNSLGLTLPPIDEMPEGKKDQQYCLSCGRDISHQRPGSKFCSEKYVGKKQAHSCRNINSNPRNYLKRAKEKEQRELTLFDTIPLFVVPAKYFS